MEKKWISEVASQNLCCCQCAIEMCCICVLNLAGKGAAALRHRKKPSNHRLNSWCVNTPLIDLNEAAAGLLVGWEPLCQHRTVNGNENDAHIPSSLLFLFSLLPTTQCHCFLALPWVLVGHCGTQQTLSRRRSLLSSYKTRGLPSSGMSQPVGAGPPKGWEVAGEAGTAVRSKTSYLQWWEHQGHPLFDVELGE